MKKFIVSMAGAATVLVSAVALICYANRKAKNAALALGITGTLAGVALTVLSEKMEQPKDLVIDDMLTDDDVALMHENISEVLGSSPEHTEKPKQLRKIEVDEDATIEDFM